MNQSQFLYLKDNFRSSLNFPSPSTSKDNTGHTCRLGRAAQVHQGPGRQDWLALSARLTVPAVCVLGGGVGYGKQALHTAMCL